MTSTPSLRPLIGRLVAGSLAAAAMLAFAADAQAAGDLQLRVYDSPEGERYLRRELRAD